MVDSSGAWLVAGLAAMVVGCSSSGGAEGSADASRDVTVDARHPGVDAHHEGVDARHPVVDSGADRSTPPRRADAGADALPDADADVDAGPCPAEMVNIGTFCVDRFEAYVVQIGPDGGESPHSPYDVIGDASVRARSARNVVPQGYISQVEATQACENAGKRLCAADEFALACRGPDAGNYYPYGGETHEPGDCNEGKGSEMVVLFGDDAAAWTFDNFNDPRLNQIDGGLARTGAYPKCVSPYGIYDCVGNLDEWGSDPPDPEGHGRFRGGYYGDAEINGPGCLYVTSAHDVTYHDYSTGFRCCRDALTAE